MSEKGKKIDIPPGVSPKQIAEETNTSVSNVFRWLREGVVEGYRLGGRTYITVDSANRLVRPWTPKGSR
jgi:hypothetical protein